MEVEAAIREALQRRSPLALTYGGDGGVARTVHPQIFFGDAAETLLLDCWQLDGPSKSGEALPSWRTFELVKIERVEPLDGEARRAPGFNLDAPKYATVLAHL
ncbi:MAG TPA: hypothetical protein VMT37_01055 [Solirubrobacterales bacterium]|nr:hypothetical protein [Solirubrobacterales bacterium]